MSGRGAGGADAAAIGLGPLVRSSASVGHDYAGAGLPLSQTGRFML